MTIKFYCHLKEKKNTMNEKLIDEYNITVLVPSNCSQW